jgi:hypothetical protein
LTLRQASDFVARIVKGANPTDLPVLQVTDFEFVITDNLLSLADEVIE